MPISFKPHANEALRSPGDRKKEGWGPDFYNNIGTGDSGYSGDSFFTIRNR